MNSQFIQVSGEDLVLEGKKIVFRGFGIGTWMNMEHFMTGMPGTDHQKRKAFNEIFGKENSEKFFQSYFSNFITEKDFIFLKGMGINVIRLPFTYRHFEDDYHPGEYREEGFKHLDRVLELCEKYGIYAVLDLHAAPGGQNPDTHADSDLGVSKFWDDASFMRRMTGLWAFIAEHYKDNRWIAAYDIINEPVFVPDADVFNDFFDKTIDAIRKVDKHHVLFLEGDSWAQDFSKFHEPQDPQIAYSLHFYPGYSIKNQYPEPWDKKDIENDLIGVINKIRERFKRPLWCGETGARFSKENIQYAAGLVKDTLDILEENDVSWTLWAYKDAQAMSLVYPKDETPWMKLSRDMGWQLGNEREIADEILKFLEDSNHFKPIPKEMKFKLQFRLRGVFQQLYVEQNLKPKLVSTPWDEIKDLPESFLLDNCGYYKEIVDLVKSYTLK